MNCPSCNSNDCRVIAEESSGLLELAGGAAGGWAFIALTASLPLSPIMLPLLALFTTSGCLAGRYAVNRKFMRCVSCGKEFAAG